MPMSMEERTEGALLFVYVAHTASNARLTTIFAQTTVAIHAPQICFAIFFTYMADATLETSTYCLVLT